MHRRAALPPSAFWVQLFVERTVARTLYTKRSSSRKNRKGGCLNRNRSHAQVHDWNNTTDDHAE